MTYITAALALVAFALSAIQRLKAVDNQESIRELQRDIEANKLEIRNLSKDLQKANDFQYRVMKFLQCEEK